MRDYGQIVTKLTSTPWLITPEGLDMILDIAHARLNGVDITDQQIKDVMAARKEREYRTYGAQTYKGVGILPIAGPIFGKSNLMTMMSGATSLEDFRQDFRAMMGNDDIHSVILEMDTPGGTADLVQETADEIFNSRGVKSTYAISNTSCGSAGLFLASQATKLYNTPSGHTGSLGVYRVHVDQSSKDQKDGYKFSYVKAGKYKTEGNPHEPMSPEGLAFHQEGVDELYGDFVNTVARGRGISSEQVLETYGRGRMLTARMAREVGMVDGILQMESLVTQLANQQTKEKPNNTGFVPGTVDADNASCGSAGFNLEVAEWEHSEPGSGTPPIPRTDEDDRSGDRKGSGSRRDTPPIVAELEDEASSNFGTAQTDLLTTSSEHGEEDTNMNEAILKALGLSAGATDEQALTAITSMTGELSEQRAAAVQAKSFAEQFPEQAKELADRRERDLRTDAKSFVADHKFVTKGTGDDVVPTTTGLSALSMEHIETTYKLIASGDTEKALDAFGSCLEVLNSETGRVEYGETGSSRPVEGDEQLADATSNSSTRSAAKLITGRANEIQAEAGGPSKMSIGDALAAAAKELPEAAKIYSNSLTNNDRG